MKKCALWLLLLVLPNMSFALGVGAMTIHSRLNQPLDADIRLINAENFPAEQIHVALASEAAYARLGVDRFPVLNLFDFEIETPPSGAPLIHVTSDRPLTEPVMQLVLAIRWDNQHLIRRFSLVLDPAKPGRGTTRVHTSQHGMGIPKRIPMGYPKKVAPAPEQAVQPANLPDLPAQPAPSEQKVLDALQAVEAELPVAPNERLEAIAQQATSEEAAVPQQQLASLDSQTLPETTPQRQAPSHDLDAALASLTAQLPDTPQAAVFEPPAPSQVAAQLSPAKPVAQTQSKPVVLPSAPEAKPQLSKRREVRQSNMGLLSALAALLVLVAGGYFWIQRYGTPKWVPELPFRRSSSDVAEPVFADELQASPQVAQALEPAAEPEITHSTESEPVAKTEACRSVSEPEAIETITEPSDKFEHEQEAMSETPDTDSFDDTPDAQDEAGQNEPAAFDMKEVGASLHDTAPEQPQAESSDDEPVLTLMDVESSLSDLEDELASLEDEPDTKDEDSEEEGKNGTQ